MCRGKERKGEMEREGIYFKELAHTIIEVQVCGRLKTQETVTLQFESKGNL